MSERDWNLRNAFARREDGKIRIRFSVPPDLAASIEKQAKSEGISVLDVMYKRLRNGR